MSAAKITVGIVGLGEMGGGMAERLLDAHYPLVGYNRTRAKADAFASKGMAVASSPREVAERSDLIITMVTNNAALQAVSDGPDGVLAGLRPGKIVAEMSTTAPALVRDLAARVAERGAQLLDAPVLGSILTLRSGQLLIMVGGARAPYDRAEPALLAIGSTVRHVGAVGAAKALKIAANLNLAVQVVAFSEGILLAEKMGVDRRVAIETLLGGVIGSPALKYRFPFVLNPPPYAWFDCEMIQKDLSLALDLARETEVPITTAAAAQQMFSAACALGYAKEDFSVVFHAVAKMAGIERDPASIPAYAKAAATI
jgi:3-hydroxyisobutyrate dehydrogenase-like beta-hydroxyacid dehydrogenase